MNDRERFLNGVMYDFGMNIYKDVYELWELEKNGQKCAKQYFLLMTDLRRLLKLEDRFYRNNIEEIYKSKGFIHYLITKKEVAPDDGLFSYLSSFSEAAINERIKTKIKQYIGIEKIVNGKKYYNTRLNYSESKDMIDAYLDDMFVTDMQRVSMYYMEKLYPNDRAIDYKYLTSLVFNLDTELVNNYFIVHPDININSSLLYNLDGYYKYTYFLDSTDTLSKKFEEYVKYIKFIDSSEDPDKNYKIDIALGYLKSILDLLPEDIEDNYRNNYMVKISNSSDTPNYLKTRIMESINEAGHARKLINYVTMGDFDDWH